MKPHKGPMSAESLSPHKKLLEWEESVNAANGSGGESAWTDPPPPLLFALFAFISWQLNLHDFFISAPQLSDPTLPTSASLSSKGQERLPRRVGAARPRDPGKTGIGYQMESWVYIKYYVSTHKHTPTEISLSIRAEALDAMISFNVLKGFFFDVSETEISF